MQANVQCVYLRCLPANDNDLRAIGSFHRCEAIDLGGTDISDAGVHHLVGMTNLQYLFLWHTGISDASVDSITNLPQLQILSVYNTAITDHGVKILNRSLPNCLICLEDDRYLFGTIAIARR
ncbi:Leucine Rich repeats (2 copies) [Rubripirellula obstinata]|uniref:Leucine Rich repeats (2 copies) n=1 Tax=Rubripirellula obstinata TaxID=406547 RepID=A0A5B1CCD3_9BACT|nr:Leucine Rich repeats (2 copies) [Rubripirellula obstinata]KAA1256994.1 Leucine Rich repeats (2 copies) [Rubripirellula obstinata]